jgi:small GTP-binding protein
MGCGNSVEKRKKDFSDLLYKKKNEEQFTYKVVLLGDVFVGKTTIIKNLQENQQEIENDQYEPTIGLAFTQKSIILENKKTVNLQLWDTSGQEIYRDLMSVYYRDSHAAILVFDHTNKQSLIGLKYWLKELNDRIDTDNIIIKIIGNKFDLYDSVEDKISHQDILD